MAAQPAQFEILHHQAVPGYVKVRSLDKQIKAVPECEGGGFMIRKQLGEILANADRATQALELASAALSYCQNDGDAFVKAYQAVKAALSERA